MERLDLFSCRIPTELVSGHDVVDQLFREMEGRKTHRLKPSDISETNAFKSFVELDSTNQVRVVIAALERAHWQQAVLENPDRKVPSLSLNYLAENTPQHFWYLLETFLQVLAARKLTTTDTDVATMLRIIERPIPLRNDRGFYGAGVPWKTATSILRILKNHVKRNGLNAEVANAAASVA